MESLKVFNVDLQALEELSEHNLEFENVNAKRLEELSRGHALVCPTTRVHQTRSCPPRGGPGTGVGIGMLRGRGIPLVEDKRV